MHRAMVALGTLLLVVSLLAACAPAAPTATPAKSSGPTSGQAPTAVAPAPASATAPAAAPAVPTPTTAPQIKRGGTARWGMLNDMMSFDSHQAKGGNIPNAMIYDTLMVYRMDAKNVWQPSPHLATEWDAKEKSVTFKLRKGVKFQDGSDFNAAVAKWNLDRMVTWQKSRLRENLSVVDNIEVVDDYTVRVNLKSASATVMVDLTDGASERPDMLSKAAMDKLGEDGFVRNPVGSGPMQLTENVSGDHYTLKKFDGYWKMGADGKPLPYLDSMVYRLLTDDQVRTLELRSGNIDINEEIFPKDFTAIKGNPDLELIELPWFTRAYALVFNMESGPFAKNQKLRQAAAYGLDREGIAKVLGYGMGFGPKGLRQPGMLGYDASAPYHWFDPAKAKQLVAESGFEKGSEVNLMVHNRTVDQQQAQIIKQQLDQIGLTTQLAVADRTANIKQREAGNYTFLALQYNQESEPDKQYTMPFACKAAGNYSRYCNPEFDRLLTQGRTTVDPAKRQGIYVKAGQIMYEDAPMTYLWAYPRAIGIRKVVKGYGPNSTGWNGTDFRELWLDQ